MLADSNPHELVQLGTRADDGVSRCTGADDRVGLNSRTDDCACRNARPNNSARLHSGADDRVSRSTGADDRLGLDSRTDDRLGLDSRTDDRAFRNAGANSCTRRGSRTVDCVSRSTGPNNRVGLNSRSDDREVRYTGINSRVYLTFHQAHQVGCVHRGGDNHPTNLRLSTNDLYAFAQARRRSDD